jgi:ABC-2 type transport system ATP-binding protein
MLAIEVKHLCKSFRYHKKDIGLKNSIKNLFHRKYFDKKAVNKISFSVESGEIVGFIGPNGAGKTTTLKMLSGILYPSSGYAKVLDYIPWERKKEFKKQLSIVMGQKNQLWWDLPANESLNLNKHIYEISDKDYKNGIEELSDLLDVKHLLNIQVRRLSLGERMKMELMAALIHKPKILFLDEPTIGLDIISQAKIRDFIKYYNVQFGITVVLTSHYTKDIEGLCKRTLIINRGEIVYNDDLSKVGNLLEQKKIIKLHMSEPVSKVLLSEIGTLKEYDGINAIIEINRQDLKKCYEKVLTLVSVMDFNVEDVPIEEGLALVYQKYNAECGLD